MTVSAPRVARLTTKGQATRHRIIEGASTECRARGAALTTLEHIMARTRTSKSQLFHYFPEGKEQLFLAVAAYEAEMVISDQQPFLGDLTSWEAWERWRDAVVDRYRRQGQQCPMAGLIAEVSRTSPGAQAITAELMGNWHGAITSGIRAMQDQHLIKPAVNAETAAASLLAGIQGGVGILISTGDLRFLEAALDEGIAALRR
jgi:AcrR family transcriptional regulator